jgi:hypothetical protein
MVVWLSINTILRFYFIMVYRLFILVIKVRDRAIIILEIGCKFDRGVKVFRFGNGSIFKGFFAGFL